MTLIYLYFVCEETQSGSKCVTNLPRVTQLVCGKARIHTQATYSSLFILKHAVLPFFIAGQERKVVQTGRWSETTDMYSGNVQGFPLG